MSGTLDPICRTFNVDREHENFASYMADLRDAVRDPGREVSGLPITRPVNTTGPPRQWLHLTMQMDNGNGNTAIVLWVRTDNLYVQGFEQPQLGGQPRWEFGRTGKKETDKGKNKRAKKKNEGQSQQHLIPESQLLEFGGGYTDLGGIEQAHIGWHRLRNSIRGLAGYQGTRPEEQTSPVRTWLRTIIITVSESMRLNDVCNEVSRLLGQCRDGNLDDKMCQFIHSWGKMSKAVIDSANDPGGDDAARYKHMHDFCRSSSAACKIVAILNHGPAVDPQRRKREARGRAVDDVAEGLTLVEIFSVAVDGSRRRRNLYGHVAIDDGLSSALLFQRGRPSAQLVGPGGQVELTGPSRALWGNGEVVMHVDLMSVSNVPDMTPDDEVGSGQLAWNTYDSREAVYDKVEEYEFEGQSGCVNVRCALVTNAVVATVVVERIGRGQKDLYGTLSAATATFGPADKITLFNRERKHAVSVQAGKGIPLLRTVAVVPLDSRLTIGADLWARASIPDMTRDGQIVKADAVFDSSTSGKDEKVIGEFTVQVTWSCN